MAVNGLRGGARDCGQAGVALVEVLVTAVVVGIAVTGIALMFSLGNTWVVAKGDDRVALSLAQQKIEQLRGLTFNCIFLGGPAAYTLPLPGCTATQNYNEGGATWVGADGTTAPSPSSRGFTRLTCVEYVTDTDVASPAYAGGSTGSPCVAGAATNVKRITVVVQPAQQREVDPPVTLQAWITSLPGGI
ncbi:MAG: hypothetical protein A2X52_19820 [Candidatus Rokubacteria bacterium GWC2_70_16]|nr:MAG: hypothetical protein A2X52_19820 [Candidatus Rokubacteria bacterium GWC2_70_16]